jgi:tripartite-type tricarboxylate transporter receptor subunit TctC
MKKVLLALLIIPTLALAWEPTHTVTVIVGNTPGAGNEIAFRELAAIVQKTTPNFVYIVENKPGADSVIAQNQFFTAQPDGYTVNLPSHMSTYVTNDIWEAKIKRNWSWDSFTDVMTMGKSPLALVASPKSKINTPIEFVRLIATTTRPINIAVGGGAHRTAYEYLMTKAHGNTDLIKPIRFNGPLPAVISVSTFDGRDGTEFGIMPIAVARPLVEAGKVKIIGFTGTHTMPQYPNVPLLNTIAPGINVYAAWSLQLPSNTPKPIVDWYQKKFAAAARSKEYRTWCEQNVVFTEEAELQPEGLHRQMVNLRETFLPVLRQIDLSKE